MNLSLSFPPMRVACRGHRKSAGYLIRIGARAGDRRSLDSLHGPAVPMNDNLPAPTIESASHLLPVVGKLRTAIERTISLVAIAVRPFISSCEGHRRLICNLRWPFKASSSLSFGSFVKHRQEPASVQNVLRSPNYQGFLSLVPLLHAHNKAWSKKHDEQRNSASGA